MVQSKLLLKYNKYLKHYFFNKKDSSNLERYHILLNECVSAEQVHSSLVCYTKEKGEYLPSCDGLVSDKRLFLSIRTADCLPIFFYEPDKHLIAGVHAGWKGLYSGIIDSTIKKIEKIGGKASKLLVAIGPHIKACCYSVSAERIEAFQDIIQNDHIKIGEKRLGNWYLDLECFAVYQLVIEGISDHNIDILPICTNCDTRYFSFRREGETAGRMYSIMGLYP